MAAKKSGKLSGASCFGTIALGLILLLAGTALKSHFQTQAAICNTFGGAAAKCVGSEWVFTMGQVFQPIGGILIGIGVIAGIVLVVTASKDDPRPSGSPSALSPRQPGPTWQNPSSPAGGPPAGGNGSAGPSLEHNDW